MKARQAVRVSRLELDAAKQTLKNAGPAKQEAARLEVENAEDDLVQKIEVACPWFNVIYLRAISARTVEGPERAREGSGVSWRSASLCVDTETSSFYSLCSTPPPQRRSRPCKGNWRSSASPPRAITGSRASTKLMHDISSPSTLPQLPAHMLMD
ncbi:hypothetical protein L226DRAFT_141530 [Lentinus tigrinus ALCF2SS1-7]|uniref:uncharacterized protein n=1 Tax=Lentinus tigrinus ALCF2SS1-7 TaxID=1328758 RepID=UPI001165CE1C|nr:hypothetical protein L226DRAFT_141530 [Lentinus tigrinus ALCF2SS1-7]